jgi:type IV pilus assembly protein PilQ
VGDSFFSQANGQAFLNFGGTRPPNADEIRGSKFFPSVTSLEVPNATLEPFLDTQEKAPYDFYQQGIGYARPNFGTKANPFQPGVTQITPGTGTTPTQIEYGFPGLFQFPQKFLALLDAKITSGNAKILTDPTLVVQEGQQATVKLTQEVVKSVETSIDPQSGVRITTPQIGEAGLTLSVNLERVDDNGFVGLSVSPTVSAVGNTQNFDSGAGAVNVLSLLSKRELSSGLVRLRDGQTLVLSGIIQDAERTTVSKVPFLGDLPLLGSLFRSTGKKNERAEVVVLLTPQIMDDSEKSQWGFNYNPSKDAREMLQKKGFTPQSNR